MPKNELNSLRASNYTLEKRLEAINHHLVSPITRKLEKNKAKIHEILTPKLI